jgi:mono/diheme cytochrome c family protein
MAKRMWLVVPVFGGILWGLAGTNALAQDNKTTFKQKCAGCHGIDGSGHTSATAKMKVPDLRSKKVRDMDDKDLYNSIARGIKHQSYPHGFLYTGLTEDQIQGLVKYIREIQNGKKLAASHQ